MCTVQNKAADLQCVACQSAKPGATVEPKGTGKNDEQRERETVPFIVDVWNKLAFDG